MKRTENDRIANRVYVGVCAGSQSVSRPKKRWTDTVKECLKKKEVWISGKQGEWCMAGVCGGECMGCSLWDELLTLRCHSYMKPLGGSLSVAKLKGDKGEKSSLLL